MYWGSNRLAVQVSRPLPIASPETAPFWEACKRGVFLIQRCRVCGKFQYHYRGFCCHCWADAVDDVPVEEGKVWTYTVVERNVMPAFRNLVPYAVALVELPQGIKVLANVINCDPDSIAIGMPVRITFIDVGEMRLPMFEPA